MFKAFKYRLYPNQEQKILLNKHFGCVRFVYNLALETKNTAYASGHNYSCFDLIKQLPDLKKEAVWLKEVNSQSLQSTISNLDAAFLNFFKGHAKFPRFKKKNSKQSFQAFQSLLIEDNKLCIPKFKQGIKIQLHRPLKGIVKQATISKTSTDKYFVSILCETQEVIPTKNIVTKDNSVGLDVGIKSFCVTSNREIVDNPKHLRGSLDRLRILQQRVNKKKRGSSNRKKANLRVAKQHERIKNQRLDFLHKLSTKIVSENQGAIIVEDLNIAGMSKRCKPKQDRDGKYLPNNQSAKSGLNKSILDCSWGTFFTLLQYKCEWQGRTFHQIGRFEPSSKMCSCGHINSELTLADREWTCERCNKVNDRDLNAAINIKKFGLVKLLNVTGDSNISRSERPKEPVEMLAIARSLKQEAIRL